ncbi:MAG: hypothetical protein KF876_17440 [Nitrospira sp.]|nr:hypothetical protein [Nitrospira sp.]
MAYQSPCDLHFHYTDFLSSDKQNVVRARPSISPPSTGLASCANPADSITVTLMEGQTNEPMTSDETTDKIVIYWEREYSTAFPPERLKLDFHPHRPMLSNMTLDEQRALAASGYKVLPDDCGPVRTVGNYGWLIRCPADVKLRRTAEGVRWQSPQILPEERLLGYKTFSGMYVDLILNSGYPKLCCGVRLYYPKHVGLMMKDMPNHFYHYPERTFTVWEGIKTQEYKRTPNQYAWLPDYEAFTANFLLQLHKPTTIKRGDPIGIILPILLPKQFVLEEIQHPPASGSE